MATNKKLKITDCESCMYYDYDEYMEAYICTLDLDEDEYRNYLLRNTKGCPYYKYYDEYKSVQKQN